MTEGIVIVLTLSIFLLLEISILIFANKKFAFSEYGEGDDITDESRIYTTRALTLGGLTFAAITFLLNARGNIDEISDTLFVLVYSFSLLLCSYRIYELTGEKRIFWILQNKLLSYGYLGLMLSLFTYFKGKMDAITLMLAFFIVIVSLVHYKELKSDYKNYKNRKD